MGNKKTILKIEIDGDDRYGITAWPKNEEECNHLCEALFTEIYKALEDEPGAWLGRMIMMVTPDAMGTYASSHTLEKAQARFDEITGNETKITKIPLVVNKNGPKS